MTRFLLASLFLLVCSLQHAVLPTTFIESVEFGNTPLDEVLALSGGHYVALMGKTSRVFSLAGNEIVFEQSVPSPERYINVIKGNGDTLFAATLYGGLDVYTHDPADGLSFAGSTDLSDPGGDVTMVSPLTCFAVANGVLVFESSVSNFSGEEWYCRSIVDVRDPLVPRLMFRTQVDFQDRYVSFHHLEGRYFYLGYNGSLYASETPTAYPDSVYVPGLDALAIHCAKHIGSNIFLICSTADQEYRIARLAVGVPGGPILSLMQPTDIRSAFEIRDPAAGTVCVTGGDASNIWRVERFSFSGHDDWQLLDTASFDDGSYRLFEIDGGYFAAGFYRSLILDSELDLLATVNESSSYFLYSVLLGRYLILSESISSAGNTAGFKIFDLQTEEFLAFQSAGFLQRTNTVHSANRLVFLSNLIEIVELGENGIAHIWTAPAPAGVSQVDTRGDLVVMSGHSGAHWRIWVYTLTAAGIQLRSESLVEHICAGICFYADDHIFVNRYTVADENFMYFYRIEQDYSLVSLDLLVTSGTRTLVMADAIIQPQQGGSVINTSDPDGPFVSGTISLPSFAGWGGGFDYQEHYLFNDLFHSFVVDANLQTFGYLTGVNLFFYQPGCFLNPGPVSCVKTAITALVANGDEQDDNSPSASVHVYPNPFKAYARIEFSVSREGYADLAVYNCKGRKVADLSRQVSSRGTLRVNWDGRDKHGNKVSPGVYLVRLGLGKDSARRKIVLVH